MCPHWASGGLLRDPGRFNPVPGFNLPGTPIIEKGLLVRWTLLFVVRDDFTVRH
jgi:hypothetical protein